MEKFILLPVTSLGNQPLSCNGIITATQASSTTTVITYGSGSTGADVATITHAATTGTVMRDWVFEQIVAALETSATNVAYQTPPAPQAISGIAIA